MNDTQFIELLNLYLDHEISPSDAARLEAEVQRNAARYRVYREYCQMHKACALLSLDSAAEVPATTTFTPQRSTWANPFAIGGLMAAAACAAFVFVNRAPTTAAPNQSSVVAGTAPAAATPAVVAVSSESARNLPQMVTVSVSPRRSEFQTTPVIHTLRLMNTDLTADRVQDVRLNWIETLQLTSMPQVPADALRFEMKTAPKNNPRGFESGPLQEPMEYNAIQFQR
jgi:hypothetical protein